MIIAIISRHKTLIIAALAVVSYSKQLFAQESPNAPVSKTESVKELADKLANPVANLISVPFQNNLDYGIGPDKGSKYTINFQPVIPVKLSSSLNMITRLVLPIVDQRNVIGPNTSQFGLSDATLTAFFAPSKSTGLIWGAGPALLIPTATNKFLGTEKFGIGPSVLALMQSNGLTFGLLANQLWSVAGSSDRAPVNQLFLQPFFNRSFASGATLGGVFEFTQNWQADTSLLFLTPTVGGVTKLGTQIIQMAIGPRIPLIAPSIQRPDFGLRAVVAFVFPK